MGRLVPKPLLSLRGLVDRAIPRQQRNTLEGSRSNISAHYDLSNELFAAFLDPSMTYSSALFDATRPLADQDLEEAQLRKVDGILDAAGVRPGTRVLEIGTGWGALAIRAARRGATVTTVTLSAEQRDLALKRVAEAGVADRVDVRLQDYREVDRPVRRHRERRDDRGRRRGVLADLLPPHRPPARPRRRGRNPGDPDGARPLDRDARLVRLDPEVHLPRRADPVAAVDPRGDA